MIPSNQKEQKQDSVKSAILINAWKREIFGDHQWLQESIFNLKKTLVMVPYYLSNKVQFI